MSLDITTLGGTLLASAQANAELIVNPNEALLTQYGTGLDVALSKTLTTSVTLTDLETCKIPWNFLGSLGSGVTITISAHTFVRAVLNNSGQTLTFGYSTGTTQTVANGVTSLLMGDGANVYKIV